ncbi:MAG: DUF5016 domain-containing protein [Prevotellaceae bacterium]|jgi:hypothetical protein|nr:DUF5016 domain-containing protein [Prevotellaceae bacterium]
MKNISKILIIFAAITLFSCKEELRVKYPYSVPTLTGVSVAETEIIYGDSITLTVGEISDEVTPLSTLEVKIVANNLILAKETVRTKGNKASYSAKYQIPFGAYMAEGSEVIVYLSAINVEGNHTDTVISSTIAHRPVIEQLNVVLTTGGAHLLPLIDAENCIYSANDLTLGNDISFYLAEKVSRFGNIDWTGYVFGLVNGGIGLVQEGGAPLSLTDLTIMGYKEVAVDLLYFTVEASGDPLQPIEEMDIATFEEVIISSTNHLGTSDGGMVWKKAVLYLGFDSEITVSGVTDVAHGFSPDFFEVISANTVKFLGETGIYTVYYLPVADYVWVEQTAATYPAALWLDGVGMGRPQQPYAKTSSWNWNSPLEYVFCKKVSEGVFQATIYVEHEINADTENAWRYCFNAKFFEQRGWGGETDARQYTINTPLLTAPTTADIGNFKGTEALTTQAGVYRFTININTKNVDFVKIN